MMMSNQLTTVFEKLIVLQLVEKFLVIYGTERFVTVFTRARHWSLLSQTQPGHTHTLHFEDKFNMILKALLDLQSDFFPSNFATENPSSSVSSFLYFYVTCSI
jgi:hypothetical protein